MGRPFVFSWVCFFLFPLPVLFAADTPGEEAVKEAIKSLKEKRAGLKDKADQALVDTAIKDLEERLTQIGKEPKPEEPKDAEAFAMPRNWELKFNTGKNRPTYDAKTGVLKLVYDFSDAKQLKDFEYAADIKPTIKKGVLQIKGGSELKHIVNFKTVTVSGSFACGQVGRPIATTEGHALQIHTVGFAGVNHPMGVAIIASGKDVASKNLGMGNIEDNVMLPLKRWYVSKSTTGVEIGSVDLSAKINEVKAGQLLLIADKAPNEYSHLTISGVVDPDWAKDFFAGKK
jgi:hypothetical protein